MAQLVVILLVVGFGYLAYKFYKALYTPIVLTPEDVDSINKHQPQPVVNEATLKEAQAQAISQLQEAQTQVQGMIEKIDEVLAAAPAETPAPKPAKKKRRYYPKKK